MKEQILNNPLSFVRSSLIACLCISICISCSNSVSDNEPAIINTQIDQSISSINDSIFFGLILDIEYAEGKYFLSDQGSNQVIVIDTAFNFIGRIGDSGPGPNEIKAINNIEVNGDQIAILDSGNGKILIYNLSGTLISTHDIYFEINEFAFADQSLIGQMVGEVDSPIVRYSIESKEIQKMGLSLNERWDFPGRHVDLLDTIIIEANDINRPLISIYDINGDLLKSTDLSSNYLINPWLKDAGIDQMINNNVDNLKRYQIVFRDMHVWDKNIYLHMPPLGRKNGVKRSYVLQARIQDDFSISLEKAYLFDTVFMFRSFIVTDDKKYIIGYDSGRGSIIKYKILD